MKCEIDSQPLDSTAFSCAASTEHGGNYKCQNTFDSDAKSDWATRGEATGAWIKINFGKMINVKMIKIHTLLPINVII